MNQPNIEAIKALDGKISANLTPDEEKTLNFCREQGRKFGVSVTIINNAAPIALAKEEAYQVSKNANSIIKITISDED